MQKYRCFFNQIHFLMFKMPFFFIHFYISTHIFTSLPSLREKQKSLTGQRKRPSKKTVLAATSPPPPRVFSTPSVLFPDKDYNFAPLHHQVGGDARLDRYHPPEKTEIGYRESKLAQPSPLLPRNARLPVRRDKCHPS